LSRIIIDLLGIQAEYERNNSFSYSLEFLKGVLQEVGRGQARLILSDLYPKSIEPIRSELDVLISQENINIWRTPDFSGEQEFDGEKRQKVCNLVRDAFIASFNPKVIHLTSFYDEYLLDLMVCPAGLNLDVPITLSVFSDNQRFQKIDIDKEASRLSQTFDKSNNSFVSQIIAASFYFDNKEGKFQKIFIKNLSKKKNIFNEFLQKKSFYIVDVSDVIKSGFFWIKETEDLKKCWDEVSPAKSDELVFRSNEKKLTLAYVSPLPPQKTGIADYSSEILPFLSQYYDVTCIVEQQEILDPNIAKFTKVQDVAWFHANASKIDRVVYHLGNSPFHKHMPALLKNIPGIVVLHDFFLGHLMALLEGAEIINKAWITELYEYHGYRSLEKRFINFDVNNLALEYPVCGSIIKNSIGVLVHSEHPKNLSKEWYGEKFSSKLRVVPLARKKAKSIGKDAARLKLGIDLNAFVVCSFGHLGFTKLNDRLVKSWANSSLSHDEECRLIFVGQKSNDEYGFKLEDQIKDANFYPQISVTGYVSEEKYKLYLMAADIGVQLRRYSRGETSAAVLDCMNYGIPTIINAHGSMSEIDIDSVYMLPDEFADSDLVNALNNLRIDSIKRETLSKNSQKIIHQLHSPEVCSERYFHEIEKFYLDHIDITLVLAREISKVLPKILSNADLAKISRALSLNHPKSRSKKRIFLDVTVVDFEDYKTGIQRVVRALAKELLNEAIYDYEVELVKISDISGHWHLRSASKYALKLLGFNPEALEDLEIEPNNGDIFIGLDLSGSYMIEAVNSGLFKFFRDQGVRCYSIVYDLLPINMPEVFPQYAQKEHEKWARAISTLDGVICISKTVAEEFRQWQIDSGIKFTDRRPFDVSWIQLGADFENSSRTIGVPSDGGSILELLKSKPSFLMVGTIEPRKGYLEVLEVFTNLWEQGCDINLVIVGKEGWIGLDESFRRDIPKTIEAINMHPQLNKKLLWLNGISDEYLDEVYKACTCLIAASYGEGFGLPLIEAAKHNLPIIARDIPVFREVAGSHAFYFSSNFSNDLHKSILEWLKLRFEASVPVSNNMPYLNWNQSSNELKKLILNIHGL
jgi:glycosyltransferase involved in cell wall biosynthesis